MKQCRCSNCRKELELTLNYVSKKRYYMKRSKAKWGYFAACPSCNTYNRVSFWALPLEVKSYFIDKWLK